MRICRKDSNINREEIKTQNTNKGKCLRRIENGTITKNVDNRNRPRNAANIALRFVI